jgi:hypothetical protein
MPKATVMMTREQMADWNEVLEGEIPSTRCGHDDVMDVITATFVGTNIEADIKLCNGDPPYVDPVLFEDGVEICAGEPSGLQESYTFYCSDNLEYTVDVLLVE